MSRIEENQKLFKELTADGVLSVSDMAKLAVQIDKVESNSTFFGKEDNNICQADIDLYRQIESAMSDKNIHIEPRALTFFKDNFQEVRRVIGANKETGRSDMIYNGAYTIMALGLLIFPAAGTAVSLIDAVATLAWGAGFIDSAATYATGNSSYLWFNGTANQRYMKASN